MFALCCDNKSESDYEIHHNPAPLALDSSMKQMIDKLLWYIPNIDSYQSPLIESIDDPFYDDFLFQRFLSDMQMQENDILWLGSNEEVADHDWEYYEESICVNCQKAIISAYKNQTKLRNFLRCVRNCIAHGRFAVIDDMLIGFNIKHSKEKQQQKAVIKIKPHLLLRALEHITAPSLRGQMLEVLMSDAFKKVGYEVLLSNTARCDFQITKNGRTYDVEIKEQVGRYIYAQSLQHYFEQFQHSSEGNPFVLIIDKSKLVNDTRQACKTAGKFIVLGREEVQMLLKGDDVLEDSNL